MEADLDDSFTFLNCLMLVFWEQFGISRRLKADLDDRFTFLAVLWADWIHHAAQVISIVGFGLESAPETGPTIVQNGVNK